MSCHALGAGHLFRSVPGARSSRTRSALGKLFQKADVLQPSLQQTTGHGFPKPCHPPPYPNPGPIPPHPVPRPDDPSPAARRATLKRTYAPSSAQMQWGENPKAKSERRAVPVPAWKGSDCWGSASRLAAPRNTRDFPPGPPLLDAPVFLAGLPRPLVPAAVPGSPSLCSPESESMPPAGVHSRPSVPGASGAGVQTRAAASHSGRAMRGGRGRGRLGRGQRGPLSAPRARRPVPVREASAGRRVGRAGRAGRRAGRRELGGAGASGARGLQTGVKYPGEAPLLHPRPAALDLRSPARSCELARPSPFPWGWPSLENS